MRSIKQARHYEKGPQGETVLVSTLETTNCHKEEPGTLVAVRCSMDTDEGSTASTTFFVVGGNSVTLCHNCSTMLVAHMAGLELSEVEKMVEHAAAELKKGMH